VSGLVETLTALSRRLRPEHAALVAAARSLAAAVDADPGSDRLWREYRAVLASLLEVAPDDDDGGASAFGDAVRTPLVDAT
jgi:hypothetical protein